MTNFIVQKGDETLTSHSGLALIGALLDQTKLKERLNQTVLTGCLNPEISHSDIVTAMLGLITLGKPNYNAIEMFRENQFFIQSLGIDNCPSSSALRQRIDVVINAFHTILKEESSDLIRLIAPRITPVQTSCGSFVPLDADVSPMNNSKTHKEGVSRTYKGFDGYSPIFGYIGQEGYLVNVELREGSQHCQKNTPQFLDDCIKYAKKITEQRLLIRLDSGNDSSDNIIVCKKNDSDFIIKRNLRKEDPEDWLKLAKEKGVCIPCREGKTIYQGKTETDLKGQCLSTPIYFDVTVRTIKKGQYLIVPEIEVDTYWSSLKTEANEIIWLYHDHGTSEQFHSEIKTDMDLERLPSGHFASNSFILVLGMLGYNLLRLCGQESLREDNGNIELTAGYRTKEVKRRRIRTVILDLIYMGGRIIHKARQWFISFGKMNPLVDLWNAIYRRFSCASG